MCLAKLQTLIKDVQEQNRPIVLAGAGTSLVLFMDSFKAADVPIACICDSDPLKIGSFISDIEVCSVDETLGRFPDCEIVLSLVTNSLQQEVAQSFIAKGVAPSRIHCYLPSDPNEIRNFCAQYHQNSMDSYFDSAERPDSLDTFWRKDSPFYRLFSKLNLENVVELACGHGRHVPQYINQAGQITLVDILEKNIQICRERFADFPQVSYYKNNGSDFADLPGNHYTALFTYDSMVHFESIDVYYYLQDTYRILRPGGMALFHHSNNTHDYKQSFNNSVHGARSYMSAQLFAHYAHRTGLSIVTQQPIDWGLPNLDCLTLVEKP